MKKYFWPILFLLSGIFFFGLKLCAQSASGYEGVARKFSPIFVVEAKQYNIPLPINFDGNWDAADNEANFEKFLSENPDFVDNPYQTKRSTYPSVYYEVFESETHFFITYYLYYPHDAGDKHAFAVGDSGGGHGNDASSLMVVVHKEGGLARVITQDHLKVTSHHYVGIPLEESVRPIVMVESGNHVMNVVTNIDLTRAGGKKFWEEGKYYQHGLKDRYQLLPIFETLWQERSSKKLFAQFDKVDETIGLKFVGEGSAWAPWARPFSASRGVESAYKLEGGLELSFVDPAKAIFSNHCEQMPDCSTKYIYNRYIE